MKEDIWYANIRAFFDRDTLINFFPSEDMSFEEKLNSFFRFCIYFSILIFLFKKSYNVFYIAFFGGVITYILNEIQTYKNEDEKYTNDISGDVNDQYSKKKCSVPSKMNPFMNVLVTDYNHNPKRPVACDISKKDVKQKMEKYFDTDLYKSIYDVFNKNS
jgi:hypothetical protein